MSSFSVAEGLPPMVDGAGERYHIVGSSTAFLLQSVDHPELAPVWVDGPTVRELCVLERKSAGHRSTEG